MKSGAVSRLRACNTFRTKEGLSLSYDGELQTLCSGEQGQACLRQASIYARLEPAYALSPHRHVSGSAVVPRSSWRRI